MTSGEETLNDDKAPDFAYTAHRDGTVRISWRGRLVTTLQGREATRFLNGVRDADEATEQRWMARVTGNFKRGNERTKKRP